MLAEGLENQDTDGDHTADQCQHLADPEIAPIEAVCPQAFNDRSAQTVPGHIQKADLAVILPLLGNKVQQNKTYCKSM